MLLMTVGAGCGNDDGAPVSESVTPQEGEVGGPPREEGSEPDAGDVVTAPGGEVDDPALEEPSGSDAGEGSAGADGRIAGIGITVSDVAGEPEGRITFPPSWILAVPVDREADLWAASDRAPPHPDDRPYWNPTIPDEAVDQLAADLVAIDPNDGTFALDIDDGDYLVCLVDGLDPVQLFGCDMGTLTADEQVTLTTGEAGVRLRQH
jgi:hypothetical protein